MQLLPQCTDTYFSLQSTCISSASRPSSLALTAPIPQPMSWQSVLSFPSPSRITRPPTTGRFVALLTPMATLSSLLFVVRTVSSGLFTLHLCVPSLTLLSLQCQQQPWSIDRYGHAVLHHPVPGHYDCRCRPYRYRNCDPIVGSGVRPVGLVIQLTLPGVSTLLSWCCSRR